MKKNIVLKISYDGTRYFGFQKTNSGISIEETLEKTIQQIVRHKVTLQAASRTDRGVHAHGQIVNFFIENDSLELEKLKKSINCLLPYDIVVHELYHMSESFHPTLDAIAKEYHYFVCYDEVIPPFERLYSWHNRNFLDLAKMRDASSQLIGTFDFSSFRNNHDDVKDETPIRTLYSIQIDEIGFKKICIKIKGNNFLYKMVRNIVGTLSYIACGKLKCTIIEFLLSNPNNRIHAGITAPASGLFLHKVYYNSY